MKETLKLLGCILASIAIVIMVAIFTGSIMINTGTAVLTLTGFGYYIVINAGTAVLLLLLWSVGSGSWRGYVTREDIGAPSNAFVTYEMKPVWFILFLVTLGLCIPAGLLLRWFYSYEIDRYEIPERLQPLSAKDLSKKSVKKFLKFFNRNIVAARSASPE